MNNFKDAIMQNRPKILHISCHGIKHEESYKPQMMSVNSKQKSGQYLLFENAWGNGELVSAEKI